MKKLIIFVAFGLVLATPLFASAQEAGVKTKFYNFDDLLIDGEYKKPQMLYTDARQKVKFERLLNFGAWLARILRLPVATLEPEALRRQAARAVGTEDIGDEACLERMEKMLSEVRENDATSLSYVYFNSLAKRWLTHRAREQQYLARHPEVLDVPIERPVFVLGFPRTGTTIMQNLLAQEPGRRTL